MASPPGTYVLNASNSVGQVTVTINYDPASGGKTLRNVGSPGRCLVADNSTGGSVPYYVKTPQGMLQGVVPVGHTDLTVNQITVSTGITELANIEMGLGPYVSG